MKLFPINIQDEEFKVAVADTDETRAKGVSGLERIGVNKGMLFIFSEAVRMRMIMAGVNFGIDFIFINNDWEIIQLGSLKQGDNNSITANQESPMVLELKEGTIERLGLSVGLNLNPSEKLLTHFKGVKRFKTGGRFEMIGDKVYQIKVDDIAPEKGRLQLLNDSGEVVANVDSGVRIFSRKHTKELIDKFKAGNKAGLADSMIEILDIQNGQKEEFVSK